MAKDKTILDEWKSLITDFNDNVEKSLEVIRNYKRDIEKMKVDLLNEINEGQYIRDDKCIVISAPRIIIGNVNKDGNLKEEMGEIIIRGHSLEMDGVGADGKVTIKAPVIEQTAVDTGLDGKENVVYPVSIISNQARSIQLDTQDPIDDTDYAASFLTKSCTAGITLASDTDICVKAAPANQAKKDTLKKETDTVNNSINKTKDDIKDTKDAIFDLMDSVNKTLKDADGLSDDDDLTKSNILAIDELRYLLKDTLTKFNEKLIQYAKQVGELAELNRRKKNLEGESKNVDEIAEDYKKKTNANILLQSEHIALHSKDGDDVWRVNEGAGVEIRANNIKLHATEDTKPDKSEVLTPAEAKGKVSVLARNVSISTADATNQQYNDKNQLTTAQFPLVGNVTIRSKIIDMESVDLKQEDENGKLVEEKLTEGSQINMRAEKVRVKTIDHQGKSVGKFSVNSQKISMKATNIQDYKPEVELDDQGNRKHNPLHSQDLAADSEMLLIAQKMNIGYKNKDIVSENVYGYAKKEVMLVSDEKVSLHTNDTGFQLNADKASLLAMDSITMASGSGMTYVGDSKFKGPMTATDIVADNLTANKAIKAPNLADGIVVAGAKGQKPQVEKEEITESKI